jgi:valyl-tRNA synthetase
MALAKRYNAQEVEPRLQAIWQEAGVYQFDPQVEGDVFSVDTPPATVSGHLHLGHVYSYTHVDLIARFWRMRGRQVFYPMGFDDNGLPTERLVEKRVGVKAAEIGRKAFIEQCLQTSAEAQEEYRTLWQRLGLSIDWRYSYRTIDDLARRTAQFSFIDLYRKGLVYRSKAPAIWCPECGTAIAQAEMEDLERESEFVILMFRLLPEPPPEPLSGAGISGEQGSAAAVFLPIATTRPELLPACVAVLVHPDDLRYQGLAGRQVVVPLFGQSVPILEDTGADPEKGSGAVMCCTFGDSADVAWWYQYRLPLIEAIGQDGRMMAAAGELSGLPVQVARRQVKASLEACGLLLGRQPTAQSVRVHERCDTPVEYIVTRQWFIRVLDFKERLLEAGEGVDWRPESMRARYRTWVENLNWDWCISRQRYFGVPFPVWYCQSCGEVVLAEPDRLPVDPLEDTPAQPCACGGTEFTPEEDIFDTWMTSSMSPQIVGRWLDGDPTGEKEASPLFERLFPFSLRPQAHEIIRTWAFYTLVKSQFHLGQLPWRSALISGWGIAGEGLGKISKSRGGGPMPPMEMIQRYSADAVRYWAASTGPGKDSVISEEKISTGARLVTKLWNVARFAEPFLIAPPLGSSAEGWDGSAGGAAEGTSSFSPADRWILSRLNRLIERVTASFEAYEYAAAKSEVELFFWTELADNYLELCKQRLYDPASPGHAGARFSLSRVLLAVLKLFSPFLPYVTEEIYRGTFADLEQRPAGKPASIHTSAWPVSHPPFTDDQAEQLGRLLVEVATAVRRFKSERGLPLGSELGGLQLWIEEGPARERMAAATADLMSITRARRIDLSAEPPVEGELLHAGSIRLAVLP